MNGLAAIRSLGRHGLRVIAVDNRSYALGFRSRYAEARLAPDPLDDEDGYIEALRAIARETDDVLPVFPTHDEHLNAIARHADELGERYRFPFPSWDVLESIQSKRHQLETAEADRRPDPAHAPPALGRGGACRRRGDRLPADRQAGRERRLPAQPQASALPLRDAGRARARVRGRRAVRADGAGARSRAAPRRCTRSAATSTADGEALGLFSGHKLSQTRGFTGSRARRRGASGWTRSSSRASRSCARSRFHGISQVEMIRDPRDGRYKLHRGEPAALAVARPRRRVRRRPAVDRVPRPDRRPAPAACACTATASAGRSRSWPARRTRSSGRRTSMPSSRATTRSPRSSSSAATPCAASAR